MTERFTPQEWRRILLIGGSVFLFGMAGILLARESGRRECVAALGASRESDFLNEADFDGGPLNAEEQRIEECYRAGLLPRP